MIAAAQSERARRDLAWDVLGWLAVAVAAVSLIAICAAFLA